MSLELVLNLGGGNQTDLWQALELLHTAERQLSKEGDNRTRLSAWCQYGRALADIALAQYGNRAVLREAASILPALQGATRAESGWPLPSDVELLRVQVALLAGDQAAADTILATSEFDDNAAIQASRMYSLLERGQ
jgi:hypothetical protein